MSDPNADALVGRWKDDEAATAADFYKRLPFLSATDRTRAIVNLCTTSFNKRAAVLVGMNVFLGQSLQHIRGELEALADLVIEQRLRPLIRSWDQVKQDEFATKVRFSLNGHVIDWRREAERQEFHPQLEGHLALYGAQIDELKRQYLERMAHSVYPDTLLLTEEYCLTKFDLVAKFGLAIVTVTGTSLSELSPTYGLDELQTQLLDWLDRHLGKTTTPQDQRRQIHNRMELSLETKKHYWMAEAKRARADGLRQRQDIRSTCSLVAAKRVEDYRVKKSEKTRAEFAAFLGLSERTYRSFRKTGRLRSGSLASIAEKLGMPYEDLVKSG
jgi:hypothetical protein